MVELVRPGRKYADQAKQFGCSSWSIRPGFKRANRDAGQGDGGVTSAERKELARLHHENHEPRLEREVL